MKMLAEFALVYGGAGIGAFCGALLAYRHAEHVANALIRTGAWVRERREIAQHVYNRCAKVDQHMLGSALAFEIAGKNWRDTVPEAPDPTETD